MKSLVDTIKLKDGDFEEYLGLPLTSRALEYKVFKIECLKGNLVFESRIASTSQGKKNSSKKFSQKAGGTQTLIIDNDDPELWKKGRSPELKISPAKLRG